MVRRRRGSDSQDQSWLLAFWVGVPVVAIAILVWVPRDIGPAYRARFGSPVPGTFTAVSRDCQRGCTSTGTWVSRDGSSVRSSVILASGGGAPRPGQSVEAVDAGDRAAVYPVGGGHDWLLSTILVVAAGGGLLVWGGVLVWALRRPAPVRRRRR